jgi:hypothetical protein
MTEETYLALIQKAKAGTLNEEERQALAAEADNRVNAKYAEMGEKS